MRYILPLCLSLGLTQVALAYPEVESRSLKSQSSEMPVSLNDRLWQQVSDLEQAVLELRGQVEQQAYELQALSQKQGMAQADNIPISKEGKQLQEPEQAFHEIIQPSLDEPDPSDLAEAEATYTLAEVHLKAKQYTEAEAKYQNYLSKVQTGEHVPLAHYRLGEIYWARWHESKHNTLLLEKALHAFSDVANGFPAHVKAKEALLKMGLAEVEKGNYTVAGHYFKRVMLEYPDTPSAKIADLHLKKLAKEGRGA